MERKVSGLCSVSYECRLQLSWGESSAETLLPPFSVSWSFIMLRAKPCGVVHSMIPFDIPIENVVKNWRASFLRVRAQPWQTASNCCRGSCSSPDWARKSLLFDYSYELQAAARSAETSAHTEAESRRRRRSLQMKWLR